MIVTDVGFACPISVQAAKQLVNPAAENWLNSRAMPNQRSKPLAILNAR
jgi:hypothetical protein